MAKKRVHEIAKEQGISTKELIAKLTSAGIEVKAAASSVDEDAALKALGGGAAAKASAAKTAGEGSASDAETESVQTATATREAPAPAARAHAAATATANDNEASEAKEPSLRCKASSETDISTALPQDASSAKT